MLWNVYICIKITLCRETHQNLKDECHNANGVKMHDFAVSMNIYIDSTNLFSIVKMLWSTYYCPAVKIFLKFQRYWSSFEVNADKLAVTWYHS